MPCSNAGAQGFHRQSMCLSWCCQLCKCAMSSKPGAGALLKPSHPASVPLGFGTPNGSTSWVTVTKSCEGEKPCKVSCNLLAAFPSQAVNEQLGDRRLGLLPGRTGTHMCSEQRNGSKLSMGEPNKPQRAPAWAGSARDGREVQSTKCGGLMLEDRQLPRRNAVH